MNAQNLMYREWGDSCCLNMRVNGLSIQTGDIDRSRDGSECPGEARKNSCPADWGKWRNLRDGDIRKPLHVFWEIGDTNAFRQWAFTKTWCKWWNSRCSQKIFHAFCDICYWAIVLARHHRQPNAVWSVSFCVDLLWQAFSGMNQKVRGVKYCWNEKTRDS